MKRVVEKVLSERKQFVLSEDEIKEAVSLWLKSKHREVVPKSAVIIVSGPEVTAKVDVEKKTNVVTRAKKPAELPVKPPAA